MFQPTFNQNCKSAIGLINLASYAGVLSVVMQRCMTTLRLITFSDQPSINLGDWCTTAHLCLFVGILTVSDKCASTNHSSIESGLCRFLFKQLFERRHNCPDVSLINRSMFCLAKSFKLKKVIHSKTNGGGGGGGGGLPIATKFKCLVTQNRG